MKWLFAPFAVVLFITAVGCKKDKPAPEPQKEKVTWKALPDSVIYITDRNIIASYSDSNRLYFLTPYLFYAFDSTGALQKQGYNYPGYFTLFQKACVGNRFRAYINKSEDAIIIADNFTSLFNHTSTEIRKSDFNQDKAVRIDQFSVPGNNSDFYVATTVGQYWLNDSSHAVLHKYKITRDAYVTVAAEWRQPITPKGIYPNFGIHSLNVVNGVVYTTVFGQTLRIADGIITDTIAYKLKNIVAVGNILYANCLWTAYTNPTVIYPNGIAYSVDNGKTWIYFGTGRSFADGTLIVMEDMLLLRSQFWLVHIDHDAGTMKEIDKEGINGTINTVNLFKDTVYIGTDAGVYYKPYKDFFSYK